MLSSICLGFFTWPTILILKLSSIGDLIDENTVSKVIKGLNETIGVALEYLQDAKVISDTVALNSFWLCYTY